MKDWAAQMAQAASDAVMAVIPRSRPGLSALAACKVVAHRGAHAGGSLPENTMPAFETARDAGVWGLETDIRWTADLVPVLIHDPDTLRVFGKPVSIADVKFDELRRRIPEVPTLEEFIAGFGGKQHLMLELKAEPFPQLLKQKTILQGMLKELGPGVDYHLMALDPDLFDAFNIVPRKACLSVAMLNPGTISRKTLEMQLGGFTGHYVLVNQRLQRMHEAAGQKIGTGFVRSRNNLYREINRGAEWVFTNDAVKLCRILEEG